MPRISYVTNEDFISGKDTDSPENENVDLCRRCWPRRRKVVPQGLDEEWISEGEDHPEYDDTDYTCAICGKPLGAWDD